MFIKLMSHVVIRIIRFHSLTTVTFSLSYDSGSFDPHDIFDLGVTAMM